MIRRIGIGLIASAICLSTAAWMWHRRIDFPYGRSHCCLRVLGAALDAYARTHDGKFPAGESSPEASLSLLYRSNKELISPEALRGKTVPLSIVRNILERGGLLSGESCGWHYVEGLTLADNGQLALVWDKIGLGHAGQRLPAGGHSVWLLMGREMIVPASEWPAFLDRQKALTAARDQWARRGIPRLIAKIKLPTGKVVDHYDGVFELKTSGSGRTGNGSQLQSGSFLTADALQWWHLYANGTLTFRLSLSHGWSPPVTVKVCDGIASPANIVFDLSRPGAAGATARQAQIDPALSQSIREMISLLEQGKVEQFLLLGVDPVDLAMIKNRSLADAAKRVTATKDRFLLTLRAVLRLTPSMNSSHSQAAFDLDNALNKNGLPALRIVFVKQGYRWYLSQRP